ncbi:MAG: hypothetical protein AAF959_13230 [Cyanobacteria bacterium P01_D01_bin.56]
MTIPMSPQEIQELAAGYVLGDLTSAEAETFQSLLLTIPELQAEVTALQEALAMMPYGLDEVTPKGDLRSQILSAAQDEFISSLPPSIRHTSKRFPLRISWAMGSLAAGLAVLCGLATLRLGGQMRLAQQASQTEFASTSGIHQTWSGLSQILQDHQRSLSNPAGPVDFVVQQPADILSLLKGFQTTVAALPLLPPKQGMLLGGSNCQLGETPGLRLTYQLGSEQTVSAYQLALADEEFPEFQSAQLTLQQSDGTGIVLWRDDDYLYALVAEMPTAELQSLAYDITGT